MAQLIAAGPRIGYVWCHDLEIAALRDAAVDSTDGDIHVKGHLNLAAALLEMIDRGDLIPDTAVIHEIRTAIGSLEDPRLFYIRD